MKVIPGVEINDLNLSASSVSDPFTATAYNSLTNYAYNDTASSAGYNWLSLRDSNSNHDPATSPLWWQQISPTEAAWNSGTAYAGGETASYQHRLYLSVQAGTNHNPYTEADYWQDIGPTNAWAMFDDEYDTATLDVSPLTFTVAPGERTNSIGFLDVVADSIQVQITVAPFGVVYDVTKQMQERSGIINGYTYFYTPFTTQRNYVVLDLPTDTNASISVTLVRASGKVSLGAVVIGTANELGAAQHDGLTNSFINYSKITTDEFGRTSIVKRRSASEPQVTVRAPAYLTDSLLLLREKLNGEPALYVGIESSDAYFFRALCVLAVATQFDIGLPYESHSVLNLRLQEI